MHTNNFTSSPIFSQTSLLLSKITFNNPIYSPNYTFIESKSSPSKFASKFNNQNFHSFNLTPPPSLLIKHETL